MLQSVLALKTSCLWLERAGGAEAGEEDEAGDFVFTISRCKTTCKLFCDATKRVKYCCSLVVAAASRPV